MSGLTSAAVTTLVQQARALHRMHLRALATRDYGVAMQAARDSWHLMISARCIKRIGL